MLPAELIPDPAVAVPMARPLCSEVEVALTVPGIDVLPPNDQVTFVSFCPVFRAMETPNMSSLKANENAWLCPGVNPELRLRL
jgi:hypothetical protein